MSCMPDDLVEGAVREVARVYELIKIHQPLFLLHLHLHQPQPAITTQMAQSLLGEALRALNIAISVMNHQQQEIGKGTTASPHAVQLSSPSEPAHSKEPMESTSARSPKRRPVTEGGNKNSSWTILTRVPYEDGYGWRKYGEKRINGTHFTKSYFRCNHKDDTGCLATKYVQQKDNSDPPVFQVTYTNEHTCNFTATSSSPAKKVTSSNPPPATGSSASNKAPTTGGHHDDMVIKQEATVVMQTPLADVVSVVPLDDHQMLPYQEPFPIAEHYVTMNVGDNSCLLGSFCNELDMEGQIITDPLIGEDDLELFFLCNGF